MTLAAQKKKSEQYPQQELNLRSSGPGSPKDG